SKMFRPSRGFCQNCAWLILSAVLYGSWILGLFPFVFNSRKKQMSLSRWLRIYGLIFNILMIFILIYISFDAKKTSKPDAFERNPLLEQINILIEMMNVVSAIVMHLINYLGSNQVLWILNELLSIEYRHFAGMNLWNCPKLNNFVIQKSAAIIAAIVTLLVIHYGIPGNVITPMMSLLMCLIQMGLSLNVMHCYLGVLFIYRYVWLINGQLWDLAHRLREDSLTDFRSSRIRELLSLYKRLLELNGKLQSAFELQMSLIILSGLAGNIVVVFFLIVYEMSMHKSSIFVVIFLLFLLLNIWDFWLCIVVCDLTERTGVETSAILKLFCDLENIDIEPERSVGILDMRFSTINVVFLYQQINEFSWLCSHAKFRFQFYGLFTVNYNTGFQMIITNCLYLLYLVQFDFMNL
ncbi:hypothetical protein KR059_010412, partial [Drosophila kikkawai]